MSLVYDEDKFWKDAKAGDWCFINNEQYIVICLSEEEFDKVVLPIKPKEGKIHWEWNGSKEAPTLSPSIMVWGKGKNNPATWHGYLRDGKLEVV